MARRVPVNAMQRLRLKRGIKNAKCQGCTMNAMFRQPPIRDCKQCKQVQEQLRKIAKELN